MPLLRKTSHIVYFSFLLNAIEVSYIHHHDERLAASGPLP